MATTEKLNIYQKLLKIQVSVMGLKKDKKSNSYEYVTGTKVLEHIKPLMNELGLLLKQEVVSIENVRQDYRTGIGTTYEKPKSEILSKVMMRFTWVDTENGTFDVNEFGANGQNDWEKGLGSALTYAERYFLLKYFHISTDEDDIDNPDRKPEDTKPNATPTQTTQAQPTAAQQAVLDVIKAVESKNALLELQTYWNSLTAAQKGIKAIVDATNKRKAELEKK